MKYRWPKRGRIKGMRYGGNRRNKWHYINGGKFYVERHQGRKRNRNWSYPRGRFGSGKEQFLIDMKYQPWLWVRGIKKPET